MANISIEDVSSDLPEERLEEPPREDAGAPVCAENNAEEASPEPAPLGAEAEKTAAPKRRPRAKAEPEEQEPKRRGRPPGARNKPKPAIVVEKVVEKIVYEALSEHPEPTRPTPAELQQLWARHLMDSQQRAKEEKRERYAQMIRGNRR